MCVCGWTVEQTGMPMLDRQFFSCLVLQCAEREMKVVHIKVDEVEEMGNGILCNVLYMFSDSEKFVFNVCRCR